jgi:hypothetical protein
MEKKNLTLKTEKSGDVLWGKLIFYLGEWSGNTL